MDSSSVLLWASVAAAIVGMVSVLRPLNDIRRRRRDRAAAMERAERARRVIEGAEPGWAGTVPRGTQGTPAEIPYAKPPPSALFAPPGGVSIDVRKLLAAVLLLFAFTACWWIVLSGNYTDDQQKGAWGVIGTVMGFSVAILQKD
jgi:hypothetical protein